MINYDNLIGNKIASGAPDECWLWTGAKSINGYGNVGRKINGAYEHDAPHRIAFREFIGPIPEGSDVHHKCRVKLCCNPHHLEPLSRKEHKSKHPEENAQMAAKKRAAWKVCKHGHEITPDNLRVLPCGRRVCVTCYQAKKLRDANRARIKRLREAAL